jgi:hypothetical protein
MWALLKQSPKAGMASSELLDLSQPRGRLSGSINLPKRLGYSASGRETMHPVAVKRI